MKTGSRVGPKGKIVSKDKFGGSFVLDVDLNEYAWKRRAKERKKWGKDPF